MAAQPAVKAKSLVEWTDKLDARKASHTRVKTFSAKTFESLNAKKKDQLLKAIAIKLGMLEESDDE